jgi:hypothetical protein
VPESASGTLETCRPAVKMSAPEGSSEVLADGQNGAIDPERTISSGGGQDEIEALEWAGSWDRQDANPPSRANGYCDQRRRRYPSKHS